MDPSFLDSSSHWHSSGHEALFPDHQQIDASGCHPDFTQAIAAAHIVDGMDPLQAALQAELQAPLVNPWLY